MTGQGILNKEPGVAKPEMAVGRGSEYEGVASQLNGGKILV